MYTFPSYTSVTFFKISNHALYLFTEAAFKSKVYVQENLHVSLIYITDPDVQLINPTLRETP